MSVSRSTMEWDEDAIKRCEARLMLNSKPANVSCRYWTGAVINHLYGHITFQTKTWKIGTTAHRLSYMCHMRLSELAVGSHVRHLCGNSLCVEPSHLTLGSAVENVADKIAHGTSIHGKNAKIGIETARKIKLSKGQGTQKERARKFHVSLAVVQSIDYRASWAWLGNPPDEDDKNRQSTKTNTNRKKRKREGDEEFTQEELERFRKYILERVTNPRSKTLCAEWQLCCFKSGYGLASYTSSKGPRNYLAHRLSYCAFYNIPSIPAGMIVRHKCKSKKCVSPYHLELGTAKENAADKDRDGTQHRGETMHSAKLTEEAALAILENKEGETQQQRAARYGVSQQLVSSIDNRRSWRHLYAD